MTTPTIDWDSELAQLLVRLNSTQQQLLTLLERKRQFLFDRDHQGLASLLPQEEALSEELQACYQQRQELLEQAASAGLPADSIQSLARALPESASQAVPLPVDESIHQAKLLRHQSITQWVVMQRTLLHLSQMLEIIATGGQSKPTYTRDGTTQSHGSLMDQAV